jgi:tRNA threonylcarbamoyl adenosine modification protein YjeE
VELVLPHRRAVRRLGRVLAAELVAGDRLWLEGPLGAGKTFFTRGLLRAMGVPEAIPVTSPTFALATDYEVAGRPPILHLDLYRLEDPEELDELGLLEALETSITVVEWGARFRDDLGGGGLEIRLTPLERGRHVRFTAFDGRAEALLERVAASTAMLLREPRRS